MSLYFLSLSDHSLMDFKKEGDLIPEQYNSTEH